MMPRILFVIFTALFLPGILFAGERRPNIVIVLADDMGWSDLGCYGGEIPTPHIDALAAKGLRFRSFYNNAVCGPSRASLLTGLYCQKIGHTGKHWNEPTNFKKCVTIAELLRRVGYRTLMVGKWQERDLPARRGFDHFFGPMCQGKISYFHDVQLNPYYLDEKPWKAPKDFYMTDAFTDHAVQFTSEALTKKTPFFLYLAHVAPHWPLHAREADIVSHRERYRQGWDVLRAERYARQREHGIIPKDWPISPRPAGVGAWKTDRQHNWQAERMAVYAAQVASIDTSVGRLVKTLRDAGSLDDTLFLVLSDNGAAIDGGTTPTDSGFGFAAKTPATWRLDRAAIRPGSGPKNLPGPHDTFAGYGPAWANVSNTPFFHEKSTAYEGGIRTPLVAHWPAGIRKTGGWCDDVGHVIDLMPTCLELAGAKYPEEIDGRRPLPLDGKSLAASFHGDKRAGHDVLCWNAPKNQAIRSGKWVLVKAAPGKAWELYDLDADAGQTRNRAAEHPAIVRELSAAYQAWVDRCAGK